MDIIRSRPEHNEYLSRLSNNILAFHQTIDPLYKPVPEDIDPVDYSQGPMLGYIALIEGKEVGVVMGKLVLSPLDRSAPYAGLQAIWVDEAYRGQGVAHALVQAFENAAKERGAQHVDIHVDVRNPFAVALWMNEQYITYQERRKKNLL